MMIQLSKLTAGAENRLISAEFILPQYSMLDINCCAMSVAPGAVFITDALTLVTSR